MSMSGAVRLHRRTARLTGFVALATIVGVRCPLYRGGKFSTALHTPIRVATDIYLVTTSLQAVHKVSGIIHTIIS